MRRSLLIALATLTLAADARAADRVRIETLSNRADLISGGDALVRVRLPKGARARDLTVTVDGRDVTGAFTLRRRGRVTGLLEGLSVGRHVLRARIADGRGARLAITNHPKGGPVFAGPQVQPWVCATESNGLGKPVDEQCNAPTQTSYVYQPVGADPGAYEPYDPAAPPGDVAITKTDEGREVPYIVRVEEGTLDRSIYRTMVLADPAKPWTALRPQPAWNRKLFVAFGGGCGTMHTQNAPDPWFGLMEGSASEGQIKQPEVIARGWMTGATGMNTLNYNCNEVVSAEALMMLKEHIADTYGPIRRTISVGDSGGSVQQHNIAAAYPGLLDGIVPAQSFPDLWNMVWDATECHLFHRYFLTAAPHLWTDPSQHEAVTGKKGPVACAQFTAMFSDAFDPQNRGPLQNGAAVRFGCELLPTETYHPQLNPTGARCSIQDYQRAIWGHGGPRGAAPLPFDNTGVQYGLEALTRGAIAPEQFVDLNVKIGAVDNEGNFTAQRASMDDTTATTMYRAGRTTDARALADVPILDVREALDDSDPEGLSDMHQPFFSHVTRARLDAVNGTHANQVFWRFPPESKDIAGALEVDRWLQAVEGDKQRGSRAEKIIRNRPADLVDTCWIDGEPVTDAAACDKRFPRGGGFRIAAGAPLRDDIRKCRLKPLRREDYEVSFTDDQWRRLQAAFPTGVCDWMLPSVGYQPSIPWMSYARGPGGTPLGAPPRSAVMKHRKGTKA